MQAGGHQRDLDPALLERQQELLQARRGHERIGAAAAIQDRLHLAARVLEVEVARLLDRLVRAVLADAVSSGARRRCGRRRTAGQPAPARSGDPQQAGGRPLDDPDPEPLAVDAGAIQVHQHGLHRPLQRHRMHGIIGRVAQRRADVGQRVIGERDELDLAVAGGRDRDDAILTREKRPSEQAVQREQTGVGGDGAEAGDGRQANRRSVETDGSAGGVPVSTPSANAIDSSSSVRSRQEWSFQYVVLR